jgi:NitT/TauT family transport system permease protein
VIASAVVDSEYILPSVGQTINALFSVLGKGEFYLAFLSTLLRSLIAFIISFVLAFVFAFFSARNTIVRKIIEPIISVIRALPTIAIILLLLFWTNSKVAPVIVTLLVVLPTSYTHLISAFESIDKTSVEASWVDGADQKQSFALVEFPQIAPAFFKAIGGGVSLNFKLMVAAEVLAQTANSIGYMLNVSKVYFEIPTLMALVLVAVVFGVVVEFIFNKISLKLGSWK